MYGGSSGTENDGECDNNSDPPCLNKSVFNLASESDVESDLAITVQEYDGENELLIILILAYHFFLSLFRRVRERPGGGREEVEVTVLAEEEEEDGGSNGGRRWRIFRLAKRRSLSEV